MDDHPDLIRGQIYSRRGLPARYLPHSPYGVGQVFEKTGGTRQPVWRPVGLFYTTNAYQGDDVIEALQDGRLMTWMFSGGVDTSGNQVKDQVLSDGYNRQMQSVCFRNDFKFTDGDENADVLFGDRDMFDMFIRESSEDDFTFIGRVLAFNYHNPQEVWRDERYLKTMKCNLCAEENIQQLMQGGRVAVIS